MDSNRHNEISRIFLKASELAPEEQAAYLDEACADDAELRADAAEGASLAVSTAAQPVSVASSASPSRIRFVRKGAPSLES